MALVRSLPSEGIPWRDTLLAGMGAVLFPSLIGFAAVGVAKVAGERIDASLHAAAMLLFLSPLLSGAGLILVVPLAGILLRQGWFGWVPAGVLGFGTGWLIDAAVVYPVAAPFGAGVALIMRALLGRLRPMG